jgi:ADP-ribose pyrophosphatase
MTKSIFDDKDKLLFQGRRFRVERVEWTDAGGATRVHEVVRHPGAVVILPLLDDGRLCLIRNHRPAVGRTLYELPAGTLEPGEDPAAAAQRELAEETGYRAGKLEHMLDCYSSPGICDELLHLFAAKELQPGPMALEAGEVIQPHLCTWDEAREMVRRDEIQDAKTLLGLLFYERFSV